MSSGARASSRMRPSRRRPSLSIRSTRSLVRRASLGFAGRPRLGGRFPECHRLHRRFPIDRVREVDPAGYVDFRSARRTRKVRRHRTALHRSPRPPPATARAMPALGLQHFHDTAEDVDHRHADAGEDDEIDQTDQPGHPGWVRHQVRERHGEEPVDRDRRDHRQAAPTGGHERGE